MYGRSSGMSLGDLVRRTGSIQGIERIRFGSLEPFALSANLLENLAETPEFCPHLHLPMQSGDEGILKRMRRGYSPDEFARYAELAREIMGDGIHISSDIIAGFPGESLKDFEATLSLLARVRAGKVHVFPFSPRRGTPAELMDEKVPREEIRSRVDRALEHGMILLDAFCRGMVGKRVDVLVERSGDGHFEGLSPHFLRVRSRGEAASGDVACVAVSRTAGGVLEGSL
jgi:threonylcarbamoyladenosine tRNA methylthiotransferase MtaB